MRSLEVTSFEHALPFFLFSTNTIPAFSELVHKGKLHFEMKNNLKNLSLKGFAL